MEKRIKYEGGELFYKLSGKGPAVVLLHGFLENRSIFDGIEKELGRHYLTLSIDLPGHGNSSIWDEIHSMEFMAACIEAVMTEEGIKEYFILGHSMGGYAGLALAKRSPESCRGLILLHSTAGADSPAKKKDRDRAIAILKQPGQPKRSFIREAIPNLFAKENRENCKEKIEELSLEAMETPIQGICAALAGMRERPASREFLLGVKFPVFYLLGARDPILPMGKMKKELSELPRARSLILKECGHMAFYEAPELFSEALRRFLELAVENQGQLI